MGRSYPVTTTITVTLENGTTIPPMAWPIHKTGPVPGRGLPTEAALRKFVTLFQASLAPGGVNGHVGGARIIHVQAQGAASGSLTLDEAAYQAVLLRRAQLRAELDAFIAAELAKERATTQEQA